MRAPHIWATPGTILSLLFPLAKGLLLPPAATEDSLPLSNYDYIVVGGGPSGLTVANRLSEDANVTVLLLEAGILDSRGDTVTIPADIGDDLGSSYDWNLKTVGQEYLDGHAVTIDQGKVVGGGTILNGMVWTRGSARDFAAWDSLNDENNPGRRGWQWEDLLPYFQKSENYSLDVDPMLRDALHIEPNSSVHGDNGPVQVAYPRYFYQQSVNFLQGMEAMGVPIISEPNNGADDGAFIAPSSMSAQNQSRSDGRVAYLDDAVDRPNLYVATEQFVTRILLEGVVNPAGSNSTFPMLQQATGVEFASSAQSARINVTCTREVILAAGAIFSPTLLQISGIGPRGVLEPMGIPVAVDLPGVGANLQDHGMIHPQYAYQNSSLLTAQRFNASDETQHQALEEYLTNRTGPLTAPMISTIAFPSLRQVADDWVSLLSDQDSENGTLAVPSDTDPAVARGYAAQRGLQIPLLRDPTQGAVEVLADSVGALSLAMQRPLSRGTVRPRSPDIFDLPPVVDPRYCADPFDCIVLARSLLFNCALLHTTPMAELQPAVQAPYFCPNVSGGDGGTANAPQADGNDTNAEMLDLVKQNLVTEFHPSGTTAMLPLDLGGVVDTELIVYGTNNLRVVDAGIMPMVLSAHLQAVVYAIAERAADFIKETSGGG